MPKKFRKKPVVIEAVQWTGDNFGEIGAFSENIYGPYGKDIPHIEIETIEGRMIANVGDWIIKGVEDEVYPCKESIFIKTYELVFEADTQAR